MPVKSKRYKVIFSFISGAAVASSIMALCWQQINHTNILEKNKLIQNAINEMNALLDDASNAINMASLLSPRNCSTATRRNLSRITIAIERIRVINIYRGDILVCSSYDTENRGKSRQDFSKSRLEMHNNAYVTKNTSVIILREFSDRYLITSSLSTKWSSIILAAFSETNLLSLRVGDKVLNKDNVLSIYEKKRTDIEVASKRYPFSIITSQYNENSLAWYIRKSWFTLFLSSIIGILAGVLTWVLLFREKTLYENLQSAIKNGDIHPWYQPIYNYSTGQIIGIEILARWVINKETVLSPHEFIPLAERTNLIINLTRTIMEKSIIELKELVPLNEKWTVGINFTRQHMSEPGFVTECINYVESLSYQNITLVAELSERDQFDDNELLVNRVRTLNSYGIEIALDDFGTGYANLNYINKICVDIVKIDRSFISKINDINSGRLLEDIIILSRNLNLKIVAEGVETKEQAEWLSHRNVLLHQGYFYSAPVPFEKMREILDKNT